METINNNVLCPLSKMTLKFGFRSLLNDIANIGSGNSYKTKLFFDAQSNGLIKNDNIQKLLQAKKVSFMDYYNYKVWANEKLNSNEDIIDIEYWNSNFKIKTNLQLEEIELVLRIICSLIEIDEDIPFKFFVNSYLIEFDNNRLIKIIE